MMMMTVVNSRHDIVNVYLRDKCPEWIRNRHPSGGVPILETDDGRVLYESLVCAQYADDANPQSRLTPADPFTKAKHSLLICEWDKVCVGWWTMAILLHGNRQVYAQYHGHCLMT